LASIHDNWLVSLGEVALLLDTTRQIVAACGDTATILSCASDDLIGAAWLEIIQHYANPQAIEGLHWAIEAAFEGYLDRQFLPVHMPFRENIVADLAYPDQQTVVVRLKPSLVQKLDKLLYTDLRHSLASVVGFTDVMLKGIGGPLSDIQQDDLKIVYSDAQFALDLVEGWHSQSVLPYLLAPVPIRAQELLELDEETLPQRRFKSHGLSIGYNISPDVIVYSNGAIRLGLVELITSLPQYVMKQSRISVNAQIAGEWLEVYLTYRAAQNTMKAAQRVEPTDLFERYTIKSSSRLRNVLSSLHALLSPYGCSAWALATESMSLATIVMNVPIWHGPTEKSS
jgi:hypothetical protein